MNPPTFLQTAMPPNQNLLAVQLIIRLNCPHPHEYLARPMVVATISVRYIQPQSNEPSDISANGDATQPKFADRPTDHSTELPASARVFSTSNGRRNYQRSIHTAPIQ